MRKGMRVVRGVLMTVLCLALCTSCVVPVYAAEEKVSVIEATARALVKEPVQRLAENAEAYEAYLDTAADFLPEESVSVLNEVLFIAQLDISPDEKGKAIIEIAQSSCLAFAQLWVISLIFDYLDILGTLSSLMSDIGILGLFLCLFGLA